MTLTTHAAIGAAIGTFIGNPFLGFTLGATSHFLVDMIPHGDNNLSDRFRVEKKKRLAVAYVTTDAACAILLLMLLVGGRPQEAQDMPFAAAVIGSILPDLLIGISDLAKNNKYAQAYYRFHFFFHDFFSRRYGDARLSHAIAAQALFVAFIVHLL